MPKIFGKVSLHADRKTAICSICEYKWNATSAQLTNFIENKMVTCPLCRVTKDHLPGKPLTQGSEFYINGMIMRAMPGMLLNDEKYQDYLVPITSAKCNHTFTIKSRYIEDFIEHQECPKCNPKAEADREKRIKKGINSTKLSSNTSIDQNNKQNNISSQNNDKKVKIQKYTEIMEGMLGKEINKCKVVAIDLKNAQLTIQCSVCGTEQSISFPSYIKNKKSAVCQVCKEKKQSLDYLYNKYIGKVYNGLIITDVYKDESSGKTVCDLDCIDNSLEHKMKGKLLGDVINNRLYCPICAGYGLKDIGEDRRLRGLIKGSCEHFRPKIKENSIGKVRSGNNSINSGFIGITCKQFYELSKTQNISLCDFCSQKSTCKYINDDKIKFSYIKSVLDQLDNMKMARIQVNSKYPSIYGPGLGNGANICDPDMGKGLLIFRDAYRGRDGKLYKFCKCIQHGTELLLSEKEIAEFKHKECLEEGKDYRRFFDIGNEFLLKN